MYMRFVHVTHKEGRFSDLRRFYDERVIPALQKTPGCVFASLLQPTGGTDESVSMTLWEDKESADEYEQSGLYDEFLDDSDDFLAESAEWRVRLTGDRGVPVSKLQDPPVEAYPVEVSAQRGDMEDLTSPRLYVRIVAMRVDPTRFAQYKERYDTEIVPVLLETQGCRAVFLVEGIRARSRVLSVTVWDSEEDAIRYELSGSYDELTKKVSEFFSGLYQWKLSLSPSREDAEVTGKDLDVRRYHVVTGRQLRE
jgi:heme-degrading monooxygenase HmoA